TRVFPWAVSLLGLAASVAANVGHVHTHDVFTRMTAAVPPMTAYAALAVGLGVLKRVVGLYHERANQLVETTDHRTLLERLGLPEAGVEPGGMEPAKPQKLGWFRKPRAEQEPVNEDKDFWAQEPPTDHTAPGETVAPKEPRPVTKTWDELTRDAE